MDTPAPLLDVRSLSVEFATRRGTTAAVRDLSFTVNHGETLAIVGESGSGKSVTALSIMRLIEHEGGSITGGEVLFRPNGSDPIDLAELDEVQMRSIRGNAISMIFQEPMTSLNPILTIGDQIVEVLLLHRDMSRAEAARRAVDLLDRVQLTDPERRMLQYPHELSGGMRQRVMIAIALACAPKLLIADEPTTALDVTIQAGILELIRILQQETGTAVIFITHDMGVVAEIADRIVVMRNGERIEAGPTEAIFRAPQAPYTRALLQAVPHLGAGAPIYAEPKPPHDISGKAAVLAEQGYVLRVDDLVTRFPVRKGPFRRHVANIHAVEGVSLHLKRGETLGLVGESGSGKSTIGRSILKLVEATSGVIHVEGRDITNFNADAMRPVRKHVQMVFQDPYASLNPRLSVAELVTEPLAIYTQMNARDRRDVAAELLHRVELPLDSIDRYPHQFSGGQRQRLCIARALSSKPKIIIADEPVSALDVSVQKQVIELMRELQDEFGIAYLFISHDLAVVEEMSHRIAVLDRGRIVETGPTDAVLADPRHDYTRTLLAAVPVADPSRRSEHRQVPSMRERKSPMFPLDFKPEKQIYAEVGAQHLMAVNSSEA